MDKYTIDLDKVLNDFEYSELTEDNSCAPSNAPFYSTDKNLPPPQYQKPTITKHSINNVFHSLNEYLNSDIKDCPELSEINEIETAPTFISKPQTSIQDLFKTTPVEPQNDPIELLRQPSSNTTLSYVNSRTTILPAALNTDSKQSLLDCDDFSPAENTQNTIKNEFHESDKFPPIPNPEPVQFKVNGKDSSTDETNLLAKNETETSHDDQNSILETFDQSGKSEEIPCYVPEMGQVDCNVDQVLVSFPSESQSEAQAFEVMEPKAPQIVLESPDPVLNNDTESDVNTHTNFMNTNTTTSISVVNSNRTFSDNSCKTVSEPQHCIMSQKERGLKNNDSVEFDSSNLIKNAEKYDENNIYDDKLLPDQTYSDSEEPSLKNESKEIKNDLTKNTNLTINNNFGSIETSKSNIEKYDYQLKESESVGFDDFDISDTEMENELEKLENEYKEKVLIENYETEIVNNVNFIKNKDEEEETKTDTLIRSDNISVINVSDNNVNETNSLNVVSADEPVNTKEETPEVVEINDNIEESSNQNRFELQRPNSLDISSEASENTTSTINLVGSPGSTPFNNVYVENSLQTPDTLETPETPTNTEPNPDDGETTSTKKDMDLNNSLSPSVSEVSTSEASDSPNTSDSCNDTSLDDNLNDSTKSVPNVTSSLNEAQAFDVSGDTKSNVPLNMLGKMAPFWTPDSEAMNCLHCNLKFTVVKRRHHCRACGLVLCSKCCNLKYKLEYMDNQEARVCTKCFEILSGSGSGEASPSGSQRPLNPANPMDYCSTVPPLQQVGNLPVSPPSVMVPVGVLKRKGSGKSRMSKSVMFCDGIRPGCDLTELDYDFNYKATQTSSKVVAQHVNKPNRNLPKIDPKTNSYIPNEDNCLPPTVNILKSEITYSECANSQSVIEMLKNEKLIFALQRNLHIHVKVINMDCCINKQAWCFTTQGMIAVGQDEIIILLEYIEEEKTVPKDIFLHLNNIYNEAVKGSSIAEMGLSIHPTSNFLESKNHAGFLYIKPTFQCVQNLILPDEPYLIGVLIHRWETPWAKIFPLRLLLRLGAEYRYYPAPIISTRHRESVYVEIGHTIINLLADFRNFSYTLPNVRGLTIHMMEKNTTVSIPQNRYDQVMKALNNSSDHILAFSANFSSTADSHLVCIQDTQGNNENSYTTHAINIQNKPRKVTGASFIVLNGALKSSSGLTAKSSIVEDGLMIQILPEQMVKLRTSLRNMKDFKINCGCVNAQSDEFVNIIWTENDTNFNVGVVSPIDDMPLSGVPSIRVHNGKDYVCNSGNKMIRWTEVFIIQSGDENRTQDPVDVSKISESISKATCQALVKYLDLLATNSLLKIGIRTNLHVENVSYLAGSKGAKLRPIYMKSLDDELIPVLHKITSNNLGENAMVIELIFHILNM